MDDEVYQQWLGGFIIVGGEAWTPEEWAMRPKPRRRPKAPNDEVRLARRRKQSRDHMRRSRALEREARRG